MFIRLSEFSFSPLAALTDEAALALVVMLALVAGVVLARLLMGLARWLATQFPVLNRHLKVQRLSLPLYLGVPVMAVFTALRLTFPEMLTLPVFSGVMKLVIVTLVYWFALRLIEIVSEAYARHYDIKVSDNLSARQILTRIAVTRRLVAFLAFIIALSAIFLLFEPLRALGVSLLASAGIAGVVLGFAAQKALGNVLAGIQIALTQPIRLDDVLVVEGEWGRVEEITLTYVVVNIWDRRRLVLPISYFIEKPFQNWTRTTASILGTVELYTDYTLPLEPLRAELVRLVESTPLWDKDVQVLQVTDCTEETMKLRVLVSAVDSPTAWDLRCLVREGLITFIQQNYPQSLPKTRAVLENPVPVAQDGGHGDPVLS